MRFPSWRWQRAARARRGWRASTSEEEGARRGRKRNTSVLEQISGIGAKRRQRLLSEFGGLRALSRAGVEDLARVNGISRTLARAIYDAFRDGP